MIKTDLSSFWIRDLFWKSDLGAKTIKQMKKTRKWLIYFEIFVVLTFFAVIFVNVTRSYTEPSLEFELGLEELIKEADQLYEIQDLPRALVKYWGIINKTGSQKEPKNLLHTRIRVSEIYFRSNWNKDALDHLTRAAELDRNNTDLRLLQGKLYKDNGQRELAAQEFLAVVNKDSTNFEAHYLLGVLFQGARQFEQAIDKYQQAIKYDRQMIHQPFELAPVGQLARLQLSRTYRQILQSYQSSDEESEKSDSDEIERIENRAITLLEDAVDINDKFVEARQELIGLLYRRASILGRGEGVRSYDQALDVYQQIVKLNPSEIDAWQWVGQIYRSFLDDPKAALEAYQKAYELESDVGILAEIETLKDEIKKMGLKEQ